MEEHLPAIVVAAMKKINWIANIEKSWRREKMLDWLDTDIPVLRTLANLILTKAKLAKKVRYIEIKEYAYPVSNAYSVRKSPFAF